MCSPAEATHNVTGIAFHGNEGRIERCAPTVSKTMSNPLPAVIFAHILQRKKNDNRSGWPRRTPRYSFCPARLSRRLWRGRRARAGPQRDQRQLANVFAGPHARYGHTLKLPGISFSRHGWSFPPKLCPPPLGQFKGSVQFSRHAHRGSKSFSLVRCDKR